MKNIRCCSTVIAVLLGGCAILPPSRTALCGTYNASIGFNEGVSVNLLEDGTYKRSVNLFYCSPLVIPNEDGTETTISGWINSEVGTWKICDRVVVLNSCERDIQNPNVEKELFDQIRSIPITYKFGEGWLLIYPNWKCVLMKKQPVANASIHRLKK